MQMRSILVALLAATAFSTAPALAQEATQTAPGAEAGTSAPTERIAAMSDPGARFEALMLLVGQEIDVSNYTSDPDAIEIHDVSEMLGEDRAEELRTAAEMTGHLDALQVTVFADVIHEKALDAAGYTQDDILAAQLGDGNTLDIYVN